MVEYPENTSVLARVQCMMRSISASRIALEAAESMLPYVTCDPALKAAYTERIQSALALNRTAIEAGQGE